MNFSYPRTHFNTGSKSTAINYQFVNIAGKECFVPSVSIKYCDVNCEASRGTSAQSVTKRDRLWVRFPLEET